MGDFTIESLAILVILDEEFYGKSGIIGIYIS